MGGNAVASSFNPSRFHPRASRRSVIKAAGVAAAASTLGVGTPLLRRSYAQESVKDQILAIPGPGAGSPSESDIERVGELTLNTDKQGAFKGQKVVF